MVPAALVSVTGAGSGLSGRCTPAAPHRGSKEGSGTLAGQTASSVRVKNPGSPENSHRPLTGHQQILAEGYHVPPLCQTPLGIHQAPLLLSAVGFLPRRVSHAVPLGRLL